MKQILIISAVLLCTVLNAQSTKKVLFIGNSYTSYNNLPKMIADAASTTGDTLIYDSHTLGGYSLKVHSQNNTVYSKMRSNTWDYVTVQAQSQEPSFPLQQVRTETFPYAKILCDSIRQINKCAVPLFYMTWGRKNGDARNCPFAPWLCTYEGMDDSLYSRYMYMANVNEGLVSPVGRIWRYLRTNHASINLYTSDESHPSPEGSYAAMCAFYTLIFKKDPTAITFNYTINGAIAQTIRNAAKTVALDSLEKWNVAKFDPMASFTKQLNKDSVRLVNTSNYADNFQWNFGDGNTSQDINPTHVYKTTGKFQITLTSMKCGLSDVFTDSVTISELTPTDTTTQDTTKNDTTLQSFGTFVLSGESSFTLYPNPANDWIMISGFESKTKVTLTDIHGAVLLEKEISPEEKIDVSEYPPGLYYLFSELENKQLVRQKWLRQ